MALEAMKEFWGFIKGVFVSDLQAPDFTFSDLKTRNGSSFQIRHYRDCQWLCLKVKHVTHCEALKMGTEFLRDFCKTHDLRLTQPIVLKVQCYPQSNAEYSVCTMIPAHEEDRVKEHLHTTQLFLDSWSSIHVFNITFSGRCEQQDWSQKVAEFGDWLHAENLAVEPYVYACVEYDAPQKLLFRKNEVWFFEESQLRSTHQIYTGPPVTPRSTQRTSEYPNSALSPHRAPKREPDANSNAKISKPTRNQRVSESHYTRSPPLAKKLYGRSRTQSDGSPHGPLALTRQEEFESPTLHSKVDHSTTLEGFRGGKAAKSPHVVRTSTAGHSQHGIDSPPVSSPETLRKEKTKLKVSGGEKEHKSPRLFRKIMHISSHSRQSSTERKHDKGSSNSSETNVVTEFGEQQHLSPEVVHGSKGRKSPKSPRVRKKSCSGHSQYDIDSP